MDQREKWGTGGPWAEDKVVSQEDELEREGGLELKQQPKSRTRTAAPWRPESRGGAVGPQHNDSWVWRESSSCWLCSLMGVNLGAYCHLGLFLQALLFQVSIHGLHMVRVNTGRVLGVNCKM